ncbi:adenylate cyclase, class 2 [Halovenus aranensis]|jgi:adenylate cyclase class 2|uniref:Adenylate cyclase, class 2 n=1 Tax=Halovenus aranensis TaxID=890420 RepID=A0A1G8S8G2_9EURY|nr:class IV adenylate cyclase [Halovenus aranensis]SDJ24990.1 adenylate cyclase, class 2 [Halovenus aranensis]
MYEVEMKVPGNHDRVTEALTDAGATHLGAVRQEDTYYDAPDRDFATTDEALRIRRETVDSECRTVVTYKGPLVDDHSKTRSEAETTVDDGESMRAVLEGLGYEPAARVAKDRERYELDDCVVTLDAVEGLGDFVEVERDVPSEADVAAAREQTAGVLETLGLHPDDQIRTSYLDLLLEETARDADPQ